MAKFQWFGIRRQDDEKRLLLERITGPEHWSGSACYIDETLLWDETTGKGKGKVIVGAMPADWADWPTVPVNGSFFYVPYK